MPLYQYHCPRCGAYREVSHSMSLVGRLTVRCLVCECESVETKMKRVYTPPVVKVEGGTR